LTRNPLSSTTARVQAETRARRLVEDADADRRALERQLHDGPQQQLVAIAVNLQLAASLCETDAIAAGALIDEISRETHDALEALRTLAADLYPPLLDTAGLVVALRTAGADAGVLTHVDADGLPQGRPDLAATVYFCCVQALRNAALHGGDGVEARISIGIENDALVFAVADDGCGFVTGGPSSGGLRRIGDRVAALGGRLEIESAPDRGTHVSGSLPLGT
jgi:signal transduction histidine kinase